MKVDGCRAAMYPLGTEHITLGSAYSDTAAVTSFSRREVANYDKSNKVLSLYFQLYCTYSIRHQTTG